MRHITQTADGTITSDVEIPDPPEMARVATLQAGIVGALGGLQQIIDGPATMTTAQLTQAVKLEARVLRRLVRLVSNQLDGTD